MIETCTYPVGRHANTHKHTIITPHSTNQPITPCNRAAGACITYTHPHSVSLRLSQTHKHLSVSTGVAPVTASPRTHTHLWTDTHTNSPLLAWVESEWTFSPSTCTDCVVGPTCAARTYTKRWSRLTDLNISPDYSILDILTLGLLHECKRWDSNLLS